MYIFRDSLTCTTQIILLFYNLYTNERMLVYNDVEIKKQTVHTMAHSKQEDSYNCGVYCRMVCFDVQTKKTCIYIMLYPNLSVVFYVTFHFNFFFLFHLFKMKPLLLSITDLTFFFTCMPYIIFFSLLKDISAMSQSPTFLSLSFLAQGKKLHQLL